QEFVRLFLDRLGNQARGTEGGEAPDPEGPGDPAVDLDALNELLTSREETRAARPPLTREDVFNTKRAASPASGMSPVREVLDEWMPGSVAALDSFWQGVAEGSLRLREMVNGVAEGVLEAIRAAADAAGSQLTPTGEGTRPSADGAKPQKGEMPVDPPATEEKNLPPSRPGDPPRSEGTGNAPEGEAAIAASMIAALFGSYSYPVLRKYPTPRDCGPRTR